MTETSLALHNNVGNLHLAAEGGQPNNEFDRINIVSDDDQLRLLLFNQGGDVAQAEFENLGLLTLDSFALLLSCGAGLETVCLLGSGLWTVGMQQAEQSSSSGLVHSLRELVDDRGNLQPLHQDGLLTLKADISRPLHIPRQVAIGLNVATNREVARLGREEVGVSGMPISLLLVASRLIDGGGLVAKLLLGLVFCFLLTLSEEITSKQTANEKKTDT